ncbi:MAG: ATP-binding cassette domain-containing protein [Mogibacterium sp.]|nr:ATP-binding cassette domain-containing protein [Mogibacterium sp.]
MVGSKKGAKVSENLISLQGVTKSFETKGGTIHALKGIDLDIRAGDSYGIIGLSGAGKSTLVRCINLLEVPTEGKVIFDGKSLIGLKTRDLNLERRKIAMIFQQFNLLMQRDAIGNVCFPLEIAGVPKKEAREKAMELLKLVDLEDRAHSYPSQLSGGQKQRVGIARALACDPKVLLCDEATSALDPKTTRSILALLKKINRELGITLVVITHEMDVIKQVCNKVAIIEEGQIVERGEVQDIFTKPKSQAARKLFFPAGEGKETELGISHSNRIRLVFEDANTYDPVVANMILELKAPVNILYADMDVVDDVQRGQMVICLSDDSDIADKQKAYLSAHNVSFEEVREEDE